MREIRRRGASSYTERKFDKTVVGILEFNKRQRYNGGNKNESNQSARIMVR